MPAPGPGMGSGLSGFVGGGKTARTHRVISQRAYEYAGGEGDYRKVGNRKTAKTVTYSGGIQVPMEYRGTAPAEAGLGMAGLARAAPWVIGAGVGLWDYFNQDVGILQSPPPPTNGHAGVPFEGPGLREPSADYVVKEWTKRIDSADGDYNLQYYLVKMPSRPYRIFMYSQRTGGWKSWGLPRPAVIGKNMPTHKMLTRLRRNLKKQAADAKTILMIASPTSYAKQLGYKKYKKR